MRCSFRIIGIDEFGLEKLRGLLSDCPHRVASLYDDSSLSNIILPIEENLSATLINEALTMAGKFKEHDFFVSVSSSEQTLIIEVPNNVLKLHAEIGGKMCFSYTCMYDPDDIEPGPTIT